MNDASPDVTRPADRSRRGGHRIIMPVFSFAPNRAPRHNHLMRGTPDLHQVLYRKWKYAAPPWRLFEVLVYEQSRWLRTVPGEKKPLVAESHPHDRVVFRPWVDRAIDRVEARITPDGDGSQVEFLVYATEPALSPELRRSVRHRLGTLVGGALRDWVDEQ